MGFKRADVEETALYAKKFVRYDEGARKYSMTDAYLYSIVVYLRVLSS